MDIRNIAVVRAMDYIPLDRTILPISESRYLTKKENTEFAFQMNKLLREKGILKEIVDWTDEAQVSRINKSNKEIEKEFLPYMSDYNSMSLWSINGLVPDDMNNIFSDKDCAVIDGLEEQLQQSQVISIVSTDTAIKGKAQLSNQAVILIRKERYDALSEEEKTKLKNNGVKIQIFEGSLNEAVSKSLKESGRYTPEAPSLRREDRGFKESETSEELIDLLDNIAKEKGIPQVQHWNVITKQNDDVDKLKMVEDEFDNMVLVDEFYQRTFFKYLFSKLDIDKDVKSNVLYRMDSPQYIQDLCKEIDEVGLEKYKEVLDAYNSNLKHLQAIGKLPTPQQIVDSEKAKKPIDLLDIMQREEISMKSVVSNAINNGVSIEDVKEIDNKENTKEAKNKEGETIDDN